MGPVTLWNLLMVVELIVVIAMVVGLMWAHRRFTRRRRDRRRS
ncbi:hypothetical protein [Leifsonia sp. 2MCAF36]